MDNKLEADMLEHTILEAAANAIEPEAKAFGQNTRQGKRAILLSIAISLKRIADKLELSQRQPIIMTAEEHIKYEEMRNARSGND